MFQLVGVYIFKSMSNRCYLISKDDNIAENSLAE